MEDNFGVHGLKGIVSKAEYLSEVKILTKSKLTATITAQCVASSNVCGSPHTLKVDLHFVEVNTDGLETEEELDCRSRTVISGHCSCKGGSVGRCKHIAALLIGLEQ